MNAKLALAAAAAVLVASAAMADTVQMKGGSVLVGETGAVNGDAIKFKSDDLGEIAANCGRVTPSST